MSSTYPFQILMLLGPEDNAWVSTLSIQILTTNGVTGLLTKLHIYLCVDKIDCYSKEIRLKGMLQ